MKASQSKQISARALKTFCVLALTLAAMFPFSSIAVIKSEPLVPIRSSTELKKAKSMFPLSRNEIEKKDALEELRRHNRKAFQEELAKNLTNPDDIQSYMYEIRDGRKTIEKAKQLSQLIIYQAVKRYWQNGLDETILNDVGAKSFQEFEPFLLRNLKTIVYVPREQNEIAKKIFSKFGRSFEHKIYFQIGDWAQIIVTEKSGKLQKLSWIVDVSSPHSENKMPSGWQNIRIAE